MFGTPSTFGAAPPSFGGGTFSAGPPNSNVFAQPAAAPSTSLFGASGFNQPKPSTFPSSFGSAQPSSMFGQQNRIGGSTMFNSGAPAASPFSATGQVQAQGTSIPFNAITGTDTMMKNAVASPINTRHQCITCMKEYEHKSLEELRLEDYQLGRKGSSQPAPNLFGTQTQPTGGLFASMAPPTGTTSTFGQRTTTFGSSTAATGGGLFSNLGQPKPNFFSTAPAATTTFGNSSSFSFPNTSQPQQQTLFGQNTNSVTSTGIGSTPFSFNQPAQQQSTLFGAKTLATPAASVAPFGSFGGTTTTSMTKPLTLFGNTTFGQTNTPASGFGSSAPTSTPSLFSSTPQPKPFAFNPMNTFGTQPVASTFNAPATSSFSFAPASTSTLNFGSGSAGGFGAATTTTASNAFNQSTFNPTFSLGPTAPNTGGFGSFGSSNIGSATSFLNPAPAGFGQMLNVQQPAGVASTGPVPFATTPYKDSPLFYNLLTNRNLDEMTRPTNPLAQRAIKEASRRRSSSTFGSFGTSSTTMKNMTFPVSKNQVFNKQNSIFDGFEEEEHGPVVDILSPKTSVKKLSLATIRQANRFTTPATPSFASFAFSNHSSLAALEESYEPPPKVVDRDRFGNGEAGDEDAVAEANDSYMSATQSFADVSQSSLNVTPEDENGEDQPTGSIVGRSGVVCTSSEYFIHPSIEELDLKTDVDGKCFVRGFTVGRANYGQIKYLDVINVAGVNIDKTVMFRHKEVVVYPDDVEAPPVGQGLNCPAEIKMYRVWPLDKVTKEPIKSPERIREANYETLLKKSCDRMSAKFISYNDQMGVWCFEVLHFSKYSCVPEESEQEDVLTQITSTGLGGVSSQSLNACGSGISQRPGLAYGAGDFPSKSIFVPRRRLNIVEELLRPPLYDYNQPNRPPPSLAMYFKPMDVTEESNGGDGDSLEVQMNPMTPSDGESGSEGSAGSSHVDVEVDVSQKASIRQSSVLDSIWDENQISSSTKYGIMKSILEMNDSDMDDDIPGIKDSQPPVKKPRPPHIAPLLQKNFKLYEKATETGPATFGSGSASDRKLAQARSPASSPRNSGIGSKKKNPLPEPRSMTKQITDLSSTRQHDMHIAQSPFSVQKKQMLREKVLPLKHRTWQYRKRDEIDRKQVKKPLGLFYRLDSHPRHVAVPPRGARVSFAPNGHFVRVLNKNQTNNSRPFAAQVSVERLHSLVEIADSHQSSDFYDSFVNTYMHVYIEAINYDHERFHLDSPQVEEHIKILKLILDKMDIRNNLNHRGAIEGELQVWTLMKILWSDSIGVSHAVRESMNFKRQQRKNVSDWIRSNVPNLFDKLFNNNNKSVKGYLMRGMKHEACKKAIREKNYTLALCLAQKSYQAQRISGSQVTAWFQEDVLPFIAPKLQELYKLCGGYPIWDDLNLERMTTSQWLQHFAVYMWYIAPTEMSIAEVGRMFYGDMRDAIPEADANFSAPAEDIAEGSKANLCIGLLKCHGTHGYPVNKLLSTRTSNQDLLDYRLSWFLMLNLQRLGFTVSLDTFESVTCSFASQLEKMGKWEWTIYVLKHLPQTNARKIMIRRILDANLYFVRGCTPELKRKIDFLDKIDVSLYPADRPTGRARKKQWGSWVKGGYRRPRH